MSAKVRTGFLLETITVPLDRITPTKPLAEVATDGTRYRAIAASVREVGIIEPLVVFHEKRDKYLLLDGHARLAALHELGAKEVTCLISTDDESFTYNNRVNRIAPIQANRMILKAIDAGAPEERIAKALNVSPKTIRDNRSRLQGICPEAIELLKDKPITAGGLRLLKRVKPMRQITMAELMNASGTYSLAYAHALLAGTPKDQLSNDAVTKRSEAMAPEDAAKMETEMKSLERDYLVMHETYGHNVMELTLAVGYLRKLFDNARVVRFLSSKHGDVFAALQKIVEATALDG